MISLHEILPNEASWTKGRFGVALRDPEDVDEYTGSKMFTGGYQGNETCRCLVGAIRQQMTWEGKAIGDENENESFEYMRRKGMYYRSAIELFPQFGAINSLPPINDAKETTFEMIQQIITHTEQNCTITKKADHVPLKPVQETETAD